MATKNNNTQLYLGTGISIGEISTVEQNSSKDLGVLCQSSTLNPWSKYKPFRNSAIFFADAAAHEAALASANYGFNMVDLGGFYIDQSNIPVWETKYEKPRGVYSNVNEPFRQLDYVDLTASSQKGYNHNAKPPIDVVFPSEIMQDGNIIMIKKETAVSPDWNADTCLSLSQVLANYTNYKFALACISGGVINVLVTDKTVASFISDSNTYYSIGFAGMANDDGMPVLPMFSNVYDGDTVTVKVYLEGNLSAGIYENRGTSSTLSLEMKQGTSIKTTTYREFQSIEGMEATLAVTYETVSTGQTYVKCKRITDVVLTMKPGPYWGDDTTGRKIVNVCVNVTSNAARWLMQSSSTPSTDWEYSSGSVTQIYNSLTPSTNFTQVGLKSSQINVQRTAFSTSANENIHLIKESYVFAAVGGGNETITISGYCFSGDSTSHPGKTVAFLNSVTIPLN